ncbi:flagellar biosynthesis protein FlhB [Caldinitratiruptor microaerophilus]|uniref:Flagellar biosynthetic protein FlhB n=1 Tax=Caldinitratiruptor microaerophilus TaxID=671077 RepID=A0AA35CHZ6_9FIRM|nr:flagellar biosynthesis protein FlhB [Caldinitratiruptor microaerophilus]BDG59369.1 flagellar biosynthesis protein FlhB [Caldinitratiruptor microaerophilus]
MHLQFFAQERTEPASPRRIQRARQRGQVARSPEVAAALTLLTAYLALRFWGPSAWGVLLSLAREGWGGAWGMVPELGEGDALHLGLRVLAVTALAAGPLVVAAGLTGLLANLAQVGFVLTGAPLAPDLGRLNPLQGLQRLFSRRALVDLVRALVKVVIVGIVAYRTVKGRLADLPGLADVPPEGVLAAVAGMAGTVVLRVGLAWLVAAAVDYVYQRWEYQMSLRMTRQEVKEELRETEGAPEVRQRIRRRQREIARRRMMAEVPRADVVITNPTHYAVALRYDAAEMDAPQVVAKGQGLVARRIREVAVAADVPVVENPPLARSLYEAVEIGESIPPELYQAVAEVLAFVYRLKGRV